MPRMVTITGDKAIDKLIRRLGDPARTNKVIVKAMRVALKPLAAQVKANTPKDSGGMRRSIKVRAGKRSRKGPSMLVVATNASTPAGQIAAVEFGTEDQEAAAPFRRAYDAGASRARDSMLAETKAGLLALDS
jgi:HK97 gp10 family phage protein